MRLSRRRSCAVALQTDAPLERQGTSWTMGAVVSWDLPAAATIGRMRRAAADRARLQSQRAFLRASIERQVYAAHRNIEAATARAEVRKEVVELARERRRIAQLQYGEQIVTATELLDAGTALAEARLSQLQAERDACVAWAKLEWATGGVLERQTGELK
jgi:outer membrane protein TolC